MIADDPEFNALVSRYRVDLRVVEEKLKRGLVMGRGNREPNSRDGALLEMMSRLATTDDLDVEERHVRMDALLVAYAPETTADVYCSVRRWYS